MHSLAWFQGSDKKVFRAFHFTLLNRGRRVDVLRTHFGAVANEGTGPDAILAVKLRHAFFFTVVAAVFVIAVRQGNGGRADKLRVQAKLWTGGIAQAAVDAAGELMVFRHLRRRLVVWPLIRRARCCQ